MLVIKTGILESKTEDVRGSKNIKVLSVKFPESNYPVKIVDWENVDELNDIRTFRSDGLKLKANYVFEYDESDSINKETKKPNINPNTGKVYINRNFQKAYEPNSPLDTRDKSPKVQPIVKKELREELRDEEQHVVEANIETALVKIDNLERHLAGDRTNKGFIEQVSEDISTIKNFVGKDYDNNVEKLNGMIESQARIEEMIKLMAKKIGIAESLEFVKASSI